MLFNQKQFNQFLQEDGLYHIAPTKYVPKTKAGRVFLPLTQEHVLASMRYILQPQGRTRYTSINVPLRSLGQHDIYNRCAVPTRNGFVSLPEYLQSIYEQYDELCRSNKLVTAWVTLQSYIQGVSDCIKEVQTSNTSLTDQTDSALARIFYQVQAERQQYIDALVSLGATRKQIFDVLNDPTERTRHLALAPFYDVERPQPRTIKYEERNFIAKVGDYNPYTASSGTETDCLLCIHDDRPKYTIEDYRQAPSQVEVITKRYQKFRLTLDEDICILQTLYFYNLAKTDDTFRAKDKFSKPLKYDMDSAPTTREEYIAWEHKHFGEHVYSYRDDLTADDCEESFD